jgi:membrane-associated phospholipid phosphatase
MRSRPAGPAAGGRYETYVLVPAVMGVGMLLSLATLAREKASRMRGHAARQRHVRTRAHAAAVSAVGGTEKARRDIRGLRGRNAAAGIAVLLLGFAGYLLPGATWNYFNPVNQSRDLAWLWALSMLVVVVTTAVGAAVAVAAWRWHDLPAQVRPVLTATALTTAPLDEEADTRWHDQQRQLALISLTALGLFALLTAYVAQAPSLPVEELLLDVARQAEEVRVLRRLNPLDETETAIIATAAVGLVTWRCRPFALTYLLAFAATWALTLGTNALVDRPRPNGWQADFAAYPSGHITTAAVMTALIPLGLYVLTRRPVAAWASAAALGIGLLGVVVSRVTVGAHWPLDAVASLLAAVVIAAGASAVLVDPHRHGSCRSCPWARPDGRTP